MAGVGLGDAGVSTRPAHFRGGLGKSARLSFLSFFCLALCWVISVPCLLYSQAPPPLQLVIVVSAAIRPYQAALDALRGELEQFPDIDQTVITLTPSQDKAGLEASARRIRNMEPDIIAAIGPEAADLCWETFPQPSFPRIFSLILNPENTINIGPTDGGVSLNIPPETQIAMIRKGFPGLSRLGLFFDPRQNGVFFDRAAKAAKELGIELSPLIVKAKGDIPFLLSECFDAVEAVWLIPDRTVISESIARHIIKESALRKLPTIGYNRFFYDSGAAFAFVLDYGELGRQAAGLVVRAAGKQAISVEAPAFQVWLNGPALHKLGISPPSALTPPLRMGP